VLKTKRQSDETPDSKWADSKLTDSKRTDCYLFFLESVICFFGI